MTGAGASALELEAVGITKIYPGPTVACADVSISFRPGEVHALLGENGAGKTTLMRVLSGVTRPTGGTIRQAGQDVVFRSPRQALARGVGMVHQHFLLIPRLTVGENIGVGAEGRRFLLPRAELYERVSRFAEQIGLPVDPAQHSEDLSIGQRQRVEIVRALYQGTRTLILDEPTAVLTPEEVQALFEVVRGLRARGTSIVLISHKLNEVREVADRITVMRAGRVVDTFPPSTSVNELGQAMVGRSVVQPRPGARPPSRACLLELRDVCSSGNPGLDGVDLTIADGEIVGIAGVDGNGQAAVEALLTGASAPTAGTISVAEQQVHRFHPRVWHKLRVSCIPSDRHQTGVIDQATVWENTILFDFRRGFARRGLLRTKAAQAYAQRLIDEFDVRCSGPDQTVATLSGGNQQKLVVARVVADQPRLVVACQPTRGLDVGATMAVHERLIETRRRGGGVLLISADLDEVTTLSDRVCVLYRGRIIGTARPDERDRIGRLMAGVER